MKARPGWTLWWILFAGYTVLDLLFNRMAGGSLAWGNARGALEGGAAGATVTWLFALWKWHKADAGL